MQCIDYKSVHCLVSHVGSVNNDAYLYLDSAFIISAHVFLIFLIQSALVCRDSHVQGSGLPTKVASYPDLHLNVVER